MAGLEQSGLTWFLQLVCDSAEDDQGLRPVMADLLHVWADERVQNLLVEVTSPGWPALFDRNSSIFTREVTDGAEEPEVDVAGCAFGHG
jgi:hypothetical protein